MVTRENFFSDLKAVSDAKGATVYKDHLPLLGESIRSGGSLAGTSSLVVGDQVLGEHSFITSHLVTLSIKMQVKWPIKLDRGG